MKCDPRVSRISFTSPSLISIGAAWHTYHVATASGCFVEKSALHCVPTSHAGEPPRPAHGLKPMRGSARQSVVHSCPGCRF